MSAVSLLHPIAEKNPCPYASRNPGGWDALSPREREEIAKGIGWVNRKGDLTPTGKKITRTTWGELSPAARNLILGKSQNPGDLVQGSRKYQEFHQGLLPDRIKRVKTQNPKTLVELGTADRIYYTREEPGGPREYYHDFGEDSGHRPTLATDPKGKQLYILGGSFKVKDWIYD